MYFKIRKQCDVTTELLNLLDDFVEEKPYKIYEMWSDNAKKLLIMNDEVIDGETFHKDITNGKGKED